MGEMVLSINSEQVLWFCGIVTALWGVWKIIKEIKKPGEDLAEKVRLHDELLKKDDGRLDEMEASNKLILQCLLIIINHDITGNGIEKMKETRDELQEYLINK